MNEKFLVVLISIDFSRKLKLQDVIAQVQARRWGAPPVEFQLHNFRWEEYSVESVDLHYRGAQKDTRSEARKSNASQPIST
jgi:hypothetical protein